MGLTLVTAPDNDGLVDGIRDSIFAQLRISSNAQTAYEDEVDMVAAAAISAIDGPAGMIGRALLTQQWQATFDDGFPPVIEIALPPIQSVDSITYVDADGNTQTLATDAYRLTGVGAWLTEIAPAFGTSWPATRCEREAVKVTFTAGYGDDIDSLPASILQAIRLIAAHLFENREAVALFERSGAFLELPMGARDLLRPIKVYR
jgi:uncharacterized phiE125 gp8 family phage protein